MNGFNQQAIALGVLNLEVRRITSSKKTSSDDQLSDICKLTTKIYPDYYYVISKISMKLDLSKLTHILHNLSFNIGKSLYGMIIFESGSIEYQDRIKNSKYGGPNEILTQKISETSKVLKFWNVSNTSYVVKFCPVNPVVKTEAAKKAYDIVSNMKLDIDEITKNANRYEPQLSGKFKQTY